MKTRTRLSSTAHCAVSRPASIRATCSQCPSAERQIRSTSAACCPHHNHTAASTVSSSTEKGTISHAPSKAKPPAMISDNTNKLTNTAIKPRGEIEQLRLITIPAMFGSNGGGASARATATRSGGSGKAKDSAAACMDALLTSLGGGASRYLGKSVRWSCAASATPRPRICGLLRSSTAVYRDHTT